MAVARGPQAAGQDQAQPRGRCRADRARHRHVVAERHRPAAARGGVHEVARGRAGGVLGRGHAPAARAALLLTVAISAVVALINVVTGTLIAWVLVRDDFRGKALVNAVIDLPFALPTIVAAIVLLACTARAARSASTCTRPGRR